MTTSPDWVFSVLLSSGLVALLSGGAWVSFLPGVVTGPPPPAPKRWWSPRGPGHLVLTVVLLGIVLQGPWDRWAQAPYRYIDVITWALLVLIMGGTFVASRRHRATGVWPSGMRTPWGFFWVLPVIFLGAAGSTVWAFATMAASSVSIPC